MKTILYVIALVGTAVAGYFSYANVKNQQQQLDQKEAASKKTNQLESRIKQTTSDFKDEEALVAEEESKFNAMFAEVESKEAKVKEVTGAIAKKTRELSTQDDELAEGGKLKAKIENLFLGQNIPMDEVGQYVTNLNDQRKSLKAKHEELVAISGGLKNEVVKNNVRIADFDKRQKERARSLRGNSVSSLITAVNYNWGFVIVKPHPQSTITDTSKLIVVRGSNHVGRLKINAIEANRVIADIDYDSVVPGFRIRTGDRVILAVENTR